MLTVLRVTSFKFCQILRLGLRYIEYVVSVHLEETVRMAIWTLSWDDSPQVKSFLLWSIREQSINLFFCHPLFLWNMSILAREKFLWSMPRSIYVGKFRISKRMQVCEIDSLRINLFEKRDLIFDSWTRHSYTYFVGMNQCFSQHAFV